jgi:hypothetical protein
MVRHNTGFLRKVSKGDAVIEARILDGHRTDDGIWFREALDNPADFPPEIWPTNFRFVPGESEFDKVAFRETQNQAKRFEIFRSPGEEGLKHWVALAKETYEKGV